MSFSTAVRLSVLLALVALPADAFAAGPVRTSSVTGRLVAPAGRTSTLSLQCPPTAVALNAAITRSGGGVVVRRSIPGSGSGDWSFRVAAAGSGSRSVTAVLRCVRLQLPQGFTGARLSVRTRGQGTESIAPGATTTATVGCGRAWTATGYALSGGSRGDVRAAAVAPSPHGWRFTLENTGSTAARAIVNARCVQSRVTARRPGGGNAELAFGVSRPAHSNTVGPGSATFRHSCGGRFSLATGSSVDPASPIALGVSSPAGPAGGRWTFRTAGAGDRVRSFLVCMSRASRFR
jgi:hypothetical protein